MQENTKTCKKCSDVKPISEFNKSSSHWDGYECTCKLCRKKAKKENKGTGRVNNHSAGNKQTGNKPIYHNENTPKWARTLFFRCSHKSPKNKSTKPILLSDLDYDAEYLHELYLKQNGLCYYTGIPMKLDGQPHPERVSVDRLDCNVSYQKDNIVLCCFGINVGRQTVPVNEFINFISELRYVEGKVE